MRVRSFVVILVPLLLLALAIWWVGRMPEQTVSKPAEAANREGTWTSMDLSGARGVDQIPGWDVRRGTYRLTQLDGRPVLEQSPEPAVEGKVLWTRPMRGGAGVRARMRGDQTRRAFPRFSVGLHQNRELHLRAFPGERKLELVGCDPDLTNEQILASVPLPEWSGKAVDWIWLELLVLPAGESEYRCEGRLWTGLASRPPSPALELQLKLPANIFFAALQGAPFALRPILLDAAETLTPHLPTP